MKFLLFRILLLHRTRDQGFTLPMVIGIGLIMVLLSSVALVQSSEENLTAISKDQSSTSLAMAELGVARYRELINNNRVLAVYNLGNWTDANVAAQTCDDVSGAWVDTNNWFPITLDENIHGVDFNDDGDQNDIETIGSAKIENYIYDNDADETDAGENGVFDQTSDDANLTDPDGAGPLPPIGARGILTVQGQAPDGGVAQIQVTIPIGVNTDDLESLDPGIWIHQESVTNLGTLDLNNGPSGAKSGNLVFYRKSTGNDRCTDVAGAVDIRDPRDLPPLITLPPATNTLESDGGALSDDISGDPDYDATNKEVILGKPSKTSNVDSDGIKRYYYEVPGPGDLTINDGQNLITDGTAKVVIYVNGNLNINGNVNITNSSDAATSRFLEIHVTGNVTIDGPGTVNIKGLINARNGTVTLSNNPTVNLTGSIWANNWDSNGTVNVTTSEYEYYSITPERTPKPLTYAPTGWEQQEVD